MRTLLLLAAIVVLGGCASQSSEHSDAVFYAKNITGHLCRIECGFPIRKELIEVTYGERRNQLISLLGCQNNQVSLLLFTSGGLKLGIIRQDGNGVKMEKIFPVKLPFKPEQILNDIYLCHTSARNVLNAIPEKWSLVDDGVLRSISDENGQTVILITKTAKGYRLENKSFQYVIETSQME